LIDRLPFGKASRRRILEQHFAEAGLVIPETAWQFIYRELLWIDGTTGLAHLYESDKAQEGRRWHKRAVVFTEMLCAAFGNISRAELKQQIDRLFRAVLERAIRDASTSTDRAELAETPTASQAQAEFSAKNAGDAAQAQAENSYVPDPDLVEEFAAVLVSSAGLALSEAQSLAQTLVVKARLYFAIERKRQNVLGEGFEDLLQLLMVRVGGVPEAYIRVRQAASDLPGFQAPTQRERNESPDIAIVRAERTELLASVKWSLRHDRQKQLSDELDSYVDLLSQEAFPEYVLITNEYDPGRLINTNGLSRRGQYIDHIYHINLDLLLGVLRDHARSKDLLPLIAAGRLRPIKDFFDTLAQRYKPSHPDT
jgi:hypothetical protein